MFQFKRNFTVAGSLFASSPKRNLRLESPGLALSSPAKKFRLDTPPLVSSIGSPRVLKFDNEQSVVDQSPIKLVSKPILDEQDPSTAKVRVYTPPATPEAPALSKLAIRDELRAELDRLNEQVEQKFVLVGEFFSKKAEIERNSLIIDDLKAMANKAQLNVRNICNEIYKPGVEMASRCNSLIEDAKRNHGQKFEKFSFEIAGYLDGAEMAIRRKRDQLEHELELYERTLVTLKEQQEQEEQKEQDQREKEAKETTDQLVEEISAKEDADASIIKEVSISDDDVIEVIDDGKTEDGDEKTDDDGTDIEPCDDEIVERSFTPCQAQRPN